MLHTEKLEENLVKKLSDLNNRKNDLITLVGQFHLQLRELNMLMEQSEKEFDSVSLELDSIIKELEVKYPNGEVDLKDGTVTFEK